MTTLNIIGAGMAGLLAANMLRHHKPVVIEKQNELPNNHTAVLRFRSPAVGDLIGIQFKKVRMTKASIHWRNPVADAMAYSRKTSGISRNDRSLPLSAETHDRWIAPPDFVSRMAADLDIRYGEEFNFMNFDTKPISTIPMSQLARTLKYVETTGIELPEFSSVSGFNLRAVLHDVEAYVSLYVPSPSEDFNRVSITGSELIVEYACPGQTMITIQKKAEAVRVTALRHVERAANLLGIDVNSNLLAGFPTVTIQRYAKILPVDDERRRAFIFWASSIKGYAYQLGRFATWRPGLLIDDLVKDVRLIDSWIRAGTAGGYAQDLHQARSKQ